jgi:hypothetical protein
VTPYAFTAILAALITGVIAVDAALDERERRRLERERLRMAAPDDVTRPSTPRGRT